MAKHKQKAKLLTNYLKADGSGWLIVLTLALLPPLGIYWTYKYRRQYMVAIDARLYGSWVDPYTGQTLTGNPYQGDGAGNDLDIDHIIPLKYVNEHGGAHWTEAQKRSYGASLEAMNNGVYIAVSASENREKSDSGPSEYYPPNPGYRCEYAKKWRDIARLYHISLTQAGYNVVSGVLIECGIN